MAMSQRNIHETEHGARINGVWLPPMERCIQPACKQEAWGLDITALAYSIIDCALMNDDDAFAAAPRISMAYAERMQTRDAIRVRVADGVTEAMDKANA